jgi:hypothetical protein
LENLSFVFIIQSMENFENEIWVTTYVSPFYEVSNFARVRSKDRYRPWKGGKEQFIKSKILSGRVWAGYTLYDLSTGDGRNKTFRLHQLAYHSFNNTRPVKGMHVDHIDGNKSNNKLNNLQFITHAENVKKGKTFTEKKSALPMYIHMNKLYYKIEKRIDGKKVFFGLFKSLEEALKHRNEIIESNWSIDLIRKKKKGKLPANIRWSEKTKRFELRKMIQGKTKYYGSYKTLEEAIIRRDDLISSNWVIEN